jgi:Protein-tyrosine phosphatase
MSSWSHEGEGVVIMPSGRTVRGRALRRPLPGGPLPEFGLYLTAREPAPTPWPSRWLRWPDFRLPINDSAAREALQQVLDRAAELRVEVACAGGIGRTGTALACLAILDGVPPVDAVAYVRQRYHHQAVETPAQRRYVARVAAGWRRALLVLIVVSLLYDPAAGHSTYD